MPENQIEENWQDDKVGYNGIHKRIYKQFGQPSLCEVCLSATKSKYEWANISGNYLQIRSDWKRLCKPCHMLFDTKLIPKGENHYKVKLNKFQVMRIRLLKQIQPSLSYGKIGKIYNVSCGTIYAIIKYKTWKHL